MVATGSPLHSIADNRGWEFQFLACTQTEMARALTRAIFFCRLSLVWSIGIVFAPVCNGCFPGQSVFIASVFPEQKDGRQNRRLRYIWTKWI
jgi:hypothetical protein